MYTNHYHEEAIRNEAKHSPDYDELGYHGRRPVEVVTPRLLWANAAFVVLILAFAGYEIYRESKYPAKLEWDQNLHRPPAP